MSEIDVNVYREKAVAYFKEGYTCAQSVVLAYADLYEEEVKTLVKVSGSFGGGMGRLREVCGAVSGAAMILGLEYPISGPDNKQGKSSNYAAIQQVAYAFKEKMGSYICADLLKIPRFPQAPDPEDRNSAYYSKRPCAYCVAVAAEMLGEEIKRHRAVSR